MTKASEERNGAIALLVGLICGTAFALLQVDLGVASRGILDFVLPVFFVYVGVELRQEFSSGYFVRRTHLVAPALAAVLGVAFPAVVYYFIAGEKGWAVPTATDLTIGLMALSVFGSKLGLRAKFLAVATLDDLIGLAIIIALFSAEIKTASLTLCVACLLVLGITQARGATLARVFLFTAPLALISAVDAGVQTSIIGFVIGITLRDAALLRALPKVVNYAVLPVFGLAVLAGALKLPFAGLSGSILLALLLRPAGKLLGIYLGGVVGDALTRTKQVPSHWAGVGLLGGIGLTVSLLITELSFDNESDTSAAVVGTLAATALSLALFIGYSSYRGRRGAK